MIVEIDGHRLENLRPLSPSVKDKVVREIGLDLVPWLAELYEKMSAYSKTSGYIAIRPVTAALLLHARRYPMIEVELDKVLTLIRCTKIFASESGF